jgi:hypothetical protein
VRSRVASRPAWSLWGLALGLVPVSLLFGTLTFSAQFPKAREPFLVSIVVLDALLVLYGTLGALIASRHPRNPIGWIFCAAAVLLGLVSAAYGYADYGLYVRDDPLPGAVLAAWLTNWIPIVAVYDSTCFLFCSSLTGARRRRDGARSSGRWPPSL